MTQQEYEAAVTRSAWICKALNKIQKEVEEYNKAGGRAGLTTEYYDLRDELFELQEKLDEIAEEEILE